MSRYPILTVESAPEASKPALAALQQTFGMIPNVVALMAASPTLLNGFVPLFREVHAGSFSEAEIQTLLLTNAVSNESAWPTAFHTMLAMAHGVAPKDVQALRLGHSPGAPKLAALAALTRSLIQKRGKLEDRELTHFVDAGFRREQVLEVIAVLAASTMTNYSCNVGEPPLEPQLEAHAFRT